MPHNHENTYYSPLAKRIHTLLGKPATTIDYATGIVLALMLSRYSPLQWLLSHWEMGTSWYQIAKRTTTNHITNSSGLSPTDLQYLELFNQTLVENGYPVINPQNLVPSFLDQQNRNTLEGLAPILWWVSIASTILLFSPRLLVAIRDCTNKACLYLYDKNYKQKKAQERSIKALVQEREKVANQKTSIRSIRTTNPAPYNASLPLHANISPEIALKSLKKAVKTMSIAELRQLNTAMTKAPNTELAQILNPKREKIISQKIFLRRIESILTRTINTTITAILYYSLRTNLAAYTQNLEAVVRDQQLKTTARHYNDHSLQQTQPCQPTWNKLPYAPIYPVYFPETCHITTTTQAILAFGKQYRPALETYIEAKISLSYGIKSLLMLCLTKLPDNIRQRTNDRLNRLNKKKYTQLINRFFTHIAHWMHMLMPVVLTINLYYLFSQGYFFSPDRDCNTLALAFLMEECYGNVPSIHAGQPPLDLVSYPLKGNQSATTVTLPFQDQGTVHSSPTWSNTLLWLNNYLSGPTGNINRIETIQGSKLIRPNSHAGFWQEALTPLGAVEIGVLYQSFIYGLFVVPTIAGSITATISSVRNCQSLEKIMAQCNYYNRASLMVMKALSPIFYLSTLFSYSIGKVISITNAPFNTGNFLLQVIPFFMSAAFSDKSIDDPMLQVIYGSTALTWRYMISLLQIASLATLLSIGCNLRKKPTVQQRNNQLNFFTENKSPEIPGSTLNQPLLPQDDHTERNNANDHQG